MLTLVPVFSIWFGIFPLDLNLYAAIALTVYFICQNMVSYYVRNYMHFKVLWFSSISNTILWVTYFKAILNTFIASRTKRKITFKATAKGKGAIAASALRDLWVHWFLFLSTVATVIAGFATLKADVGFNIYNTIVW